MEYIREIIIVTYIVVYLGKGKTNYAKLKSFCFFPDVARKAVLFYFLFLLSFQSNFYYLFKKKKVDQKFNFLFLCRHS